MLTKTRWSMLSLLAGAALFAAGCGDDDDGDPGDGGGSVDGGTRADSGAPVADGGSIEIDSAAPSADAAVADLHFIGRFDRSSAEAARFAWPGSALWTRFDGTELGVELEDGGQNRFDVVIDGGPAELLILQAGRHTYALASGLSDGPHELRLTRRTESFLGTTVFHGFSGAPLLPSPVPDRWLEFVGDSITCGYGVIGAGPGCGFSASTEAETRAYGALSAAELGAAHTAIAWSGRGMFRNFNNEDPGVTMPVLWTRTIAPEASSTWDFSLPDPAAVVVNLGTNDFSLGDPGEGFAEAYDGFVQTLRQQYPGAWIFAATSPMLSDGFPAGEMRRTRHHQYLEAVVAAATARGDERVSILELAEQDPNDGYGCDFHPNEVTNQKMAAVVVAAVRQVTGW